jgi:hypothetical protein
MACATASSNDGGVTTLFWLGIISVGMLALLTGIRSTIGAYTAPEVPSLSNVSMKVDTTSWHVDSAKVSAIEYDIEHALEKHGPEQEALAEKCFNESNLKFTYAKSFNEDRRVNLCLNMGNFLAIQVVEKIGGKWHQITKYCNFDLKTIDDMIDYFVVDSGKYGYITYLSDAMKEFILSIFP